MAGAKEQTELQVFKVVLTYCIIIIICPVMSFFISKSYIFSGLLGLSAAASNIYAAVVAVLVLHVALGAFLYRAYFDAPKVQTKVQEKAD